jgi:glycogen phosphorylase
MIRIRKSSALPWLPSSLSPLLGIAHNLPWSWNHAAIELFRRSDCDLWETCGHDPFLLSGTDGFVCAVGKMKVADPNGGIANAARAMAVR